jgi:hypothetical protein
VKEVDMVEKPFHIEADSRKIRDEVPEKVVWPIQV